MSQPDDKLRPRVDRLLHQSTAAVIFLTRFPIRANRAVTPADLAASAPFFPLAGAGLGVLSALVSASALTIGLAPLISATLAVLTLILLTGGQHEEGLAATADGLGGSDRGRMLEIMRGPRIGNFGVLALVLTILLRVGAIAALAEPALVLAALIGAGALSRAPLPVMMQLLPLARDDEGPPRAGQPIGPRAVVAVMLGVLIAGLTLGPIIALAALLLTAGAVSAIGALSLRLIGGLTADVLGAAQQTSEILILLGVVTLAPVMQ